MSTVSPGPHWRDEFRSLAQQGCFRELEQLAEQYRPCLAGQDLQELGALLQGFGLLTAAACCYEQLRQQSPEDLAGLANLANLAFERGDHRRSRELYVALLQYLPDHPIIRRNLLTSLEYDPDLSDSVRREQARLWGQWAIEQAGGLRERPLRPPLQGRPLNLGYLSADFCQHTVGWLVKDVILSHDPQQVRVTLYSAGGVEDWLTHQLQQQVGFRPVAGWSDGAIADQIRADDIDVLVDLSGHTAGSRLSVLAHRPAPVQVSWLGYFATTGLPTVDAVLMDHWHVPPGAEQQFVEPVLRLPRGRFCYQPVPFAPEVLPPPSLTRSHITFGCFNNTAKLNGVVLDCWANLLRQLPTSRLILKWRTLNDSALREELKQLFAQRGIDPARLELRGPSFHGELLREYGDIDIALDPFPFTGGLTSCEALWMGVPVVTWPQSRAVSRQTFAFLSAIGLADLAAWDAEDYVRRAVDLARDRPRLAMLRQQLRERMRLSVLCDLSGFTRSLEDQLRSLYRLLTE